MQNSKLKYVKALVVDDELPIVEVLSDLLYEIGVDEVIEMRSGEKALEAFDKENPDIVFSDVIMLKMSGISLLRKLKAKNKKIPVILISGFHEYSKILEQSGAKPDGFLEKPIKMDTIKTILYKHFPHLKDKN